MNEGRLSIFNRKGDRLAEIPAAVQVAWVLGDAGRGEFAIATSDPNCTEDIIKIGNFALYEHASLGEWGGVITPHGGIEWSSRGYVSVGCLSAEHLFARRRGPANRIYEGTAGNIFTRIVRKANAEEDLRIREGDIWEGGAQQHLPCRDDSLLSLVKQLQEDSGHDWWLEPEFTSNGRLYFSANWRRRLAHRTYYPLIEGHNLESPAGALLRQEGDLVNDMAIVGEGATTDTKPRLETRNDDSIADHGLWQGADAVNAKNISQLKNRAQDVIAHSSTPEKRFWLTAIETPNSLDTFAHTKVGDVVNVYLHSVDFYGDGKGVETTVRILAREFNSNANKAILVAEEVIV